VRTSSETEPNRAEWIAGCLLSAMFGLLEIAAKAESWKLIAVALLIPIAFCVVRLLAADPRSD
jgi:hypothetical protein